MTKVKVKAFVEALANFHDDLSEMKKYPNDKRLTQSEKKILESWLLLADNKLSQILETLPKLVTDYDELVESQKQLIWGLALNNKGEFLSARGHVEASLPALEKYQLKNLQFTAFHNLFIVYYNLHDTDGMALCLDQMREYQSEAERRGLILLQCEFYYLSFVNQLQKAAKILEQVEKKKELMNEPMRVTFLIVKFNFYVKQQKYIECRETLDELKHLKKFAFSANYRFMNTLLSHLKDNAPIYAYEREYAEFPFLFHQIMVVKFLEENKIHEASVYWAKLQIQYPKMYGEDFEFKGDKCLFSMGVEKHRPKKVVAQVLPMVSNKEKAILQVLKSSSSPLDKEQLYALVWGEVPLDKIEIGKMQRMISRLRDKGHDISYRKGCYSLAPSKTKVS